MKDVDRRSLAEPEGSSSGKVTSKARELRAIALRLNRLADEFESNPALIDAIPMPPQPFGSFPVAGDNTDRLSQLRTLFSWHVAAAIAGSIGGFLASRRGISCWMPFNTG